MTGVSVLTLVRNRTAHLRNLVDGLARSERAPDELVVAWMGGESPFAALDGVACPVRVVDLDAPAGTLPLARARNAAVHAARHDLLVLLDVDCIPGRELVGRYADALAGCDGLLMGAVRYLPGGAVGPGWEEEHLLSAGREHPQRTAPPEGSVVSTDRYDLFWSLSFAIRKRTYLGQIGGFDERFVGYGAEDTDFAFAARQSDVPLGWVPDALAFHQDHEHFDPPLQHLSDIVVNAARFHAKWGRWPMEGWLARFAQMGLVAWNDDELRLLRRPRPEELAAARSRAYPGDRAAAS